MNTSSEQEQFSGRLKKAQRDVGCPIHSPTKLAREFNTHYSGVPISSHAMRKWLFGESIPTQDKLRVLAQWLNVGPDWLRFGEELGSEESSSRQVSGQIGPADLMFISDLHSLNDSDLEIVRWVTRLLARADVRIPDLKRLMGLQSN